MSITVLFVDVLCVSYSRGGARARFEKKLEVCHKYPFFQRHIKNLEHPNDRYLIYIFHDHSLGSNGGLGDRLGGLITAFAYAMRTNRTLLIFGDGSFNDAFEPYHPNNIDGKYNWKSWDWSGLSKSSYPTIGAETNRFTKCVNPRPGQQFCALDKELNHKVIKVRSNRAYLCRWAIRNDLVDPAHLQETLGLGHDSDLFEMAGCMLRLAMWPSEKLWAAVDMSLEQDPNVKGKVEFEDFVTDSQVGIHFRCGDSSFGASAKSKINPECVFTSHESWKGTSFFDDHSLDSPIDAGKCGSHWASALSTDMSAGTTSSAPVINIPKKRTLVFIASDYPPSAQQINNTIGWLYSITPPQGCHVDIQANDRCTLITSVHWLMLALSDQIVMQSMLVGEVQRNSSYSDAKYYYSYSDKSSGTQSRHEQPAPISAFSRFAAIYSLSPGGIVYGSHCKTIDPVALSHQTQGNWVCNPRVFF